MKRLSILIWVLLFVPCSGANFYVRSTDGSNSDNGSTWALAKATIAGAFSASSAGDTIYVSQVHAETQATALSLNNAGSSTSPVLVICGNDSATPPTSLATTATVTTTGANSISGTGFTYWYGLTFTAGDSTNSASITLPSSGTTTNVFDHCNFVLGNTNAASRINLGQNGGSGVSRYDSCGFLFGSTSQSFTVQSPNWFIGGSVAATGSIPTTLITGYFNSQDVEFRGVDLSTFGSGKTLVAASGAAGSQKARFKFVNCKLGASVTVGTTTTLGNEIYVVNSDPSANYRFEYHTSFGDITTDTSVVRTGGSTDGTTPFSRKMVSTTDAKYHSPLRATPIYFWINTTGSPITVAAEVATNNVTTTNATAWIEVDYLGTSSIPISSVSSSRSANILTSASNNPTSSVTWSNVPGTPVKQTLTTTFTPQVKGLCRAVVCLGSGGTTMYVDNLRLPASVRQYSLGESEINEGIPSGGGGVSMSRVTNYAN